MEPKRELRLTNIDSMSREDLLKVFTSYASPMHQRPHRKKSPVKQQSQTTNTRTNITTSGLKRNHERIHAPCSTNTISRTDLTRPNCDSMDHDAHETKKIKIYNSSATEQNDNGFKRLYNKMVK